MSEGFQADQDKVCYNNKDENAFSNEEIDSISFIHDSIFSYSFQEDDFQDDFGNINNVEDSLIEQHDDEIVDLDPCEDHQLIEDHIQSPFVGSDHGPLAIAKFLKEEPYQYYNQLVALKYNDLYVSQKPFQEKLQDDCNDTEDGNIVHALDSVSNASSVIKFYEDKLVFDEYPYSEGKICSSTCIEPYNSSPLFDDVEIEEEKSLISTPMRIYNRDLVYDNYEEDS